MGASTAQGLLGRSPNRFLFNPFSFPQKKRGKNNNLNNTLKTNRLTIHNISYVKRVVETSKKSEIMLIN